MKYLDWPKTVDLRGKENGWQLLEAFIEAGVWTCVNDLLPVTTEPQSFPMGLAPGVSSCTCAGPTTNLCRDTAPPLTVLELAPDGDTQTRPDSWLEHLSLGSPRPSERYVTF